MALLFYGQSVVPEKSPAAALLSIGFPVLIVGGMWLARRMVGAAKGRLTYPRTGYVGYQRPSPRRRVITLVVGGGISALLVGLVIRFAPTAFAWMPLLQGVFVGLIIILIGQGLTRFYVLGVSAALLGALLSLSGLGDEAADVVFYGILGIAMALSGAVTLWRFLRMNPPAPPEEQP